MTKCAGDVEELAWVPESGRGHPSEPQGHKQLWGRDTGAPMR